MSETVKCPDCGHPNPPGSTACAECQFPLTEDVIPGRVEATPPAPRGPMPRRPVRPRRPRPGADVSLSLWLGVGAFLALLLILIAVQASVERHNPPVEGSNADQQKQADEMRAALARDSTDTQSRVRLADILFDTGNWSEAIIHYRSAVNHDSTLVPALVDLGVCYYNLSAPDLAERHFRLALAREPNHPFALFNMGIVNEQRGEADKALEFFHRALQNSPPENMRQALVEAIQRLSKQTGKTAPPLNAPR